MSFTAPVQMLNDVDYNIVVENIRGKVLELKTSPSRFQSIKDRSAKSEQIPESGREMQTGKYKTYWKGISMLKDCRDMIVYQQILSEVKPRTIIELGTYLGGSALWTADTMRCYNLPFHIYTLDVNHKIIHNDVKEDPDITCILGDAGMIEVAFPVEMLKSLPHPWFIIEDCHVNLSGTMTHFAAHMIKGDYFAVEDTSPVTWDISHMSEWGFTSENEVGDSKWLTLKEFLVEQGDDFMVDSFYTDYFSFNGTNTWDGYIKKMK